MRFLAIDTSTEHLSIAVGSKEEILFEKTVQLKAKFSEKIMLLIDQALKRSKLSVGKIDGFVVGLGPGSFTSLRVGLATVKGMSFATGRPILGISSLDAIAMNIPGNAENIYVMTDARRKLIYSACYNKKSQELKRQGSYRLESIEEIFKKLSKNEETCFNSSRLGTSANWISCLKYSIKAMAKPCSGPCHRCDPFDTEMN